MALMQIAEPGQSQAPHTRKNVVGIDLGTTNSLISTVRSGSPQVLSDKEHRLIPSVVKYKKGQEPIVGRQALVSEKDTASSTIVSVKSYLGKTIEEVEERLGSKRLYHLKDLDGKMVAFETEAGIKNPIEVTADILRYLKLRSDSAFEGEVDACVITVPAYFDENQRQATKDAAELAGLEVLRLLNEPTAAAVAYGLDEGQESSVYAIYDLGGGTFDISVLHLTKGVYEVLATGGDGNIGGDDFDNLLLDWIVKNSGLSFDALNPDQLRSLSEKAKAAKHALSHTEQTEIDLSEYKKENLNLSLDAFNELIAPLIKKTLRSVKQVLKEADCNAEDVDEIILVGGSTRLLLVQNKLEEVFGKPVKCDINPDEVVSLGAAIQADALAGNAIDSNLLLDVTPLSLGIETMGGLVEKIIHRNTPIPITRAQEFTTFQDGQTAMSLHVVQGEREQVDHCRSLARFELTNIPPMVAGAAKIKVSFQIDADGLLTVSALEETSETKTSIQVKPSYGLEIEEIGAMLKDSYEFAEVDMQARSLAEEQVEAKRMLLALNAALDSDGGKYLSASELEELQGMMQSLELNLSSHTAEQLRAEIEALNLASQAFAARRMDAGIQEAFSGRKLEEIT